MKIIKVIDVQDGQVVKLPEEFRFRDSNVSIRKAGEAVILEPVKPATWPPGFFDDIKIDDLAFGRPDQGRTPTAPSLGATGSASAYGMRSGNRGLIKN